MAFTRSNNHDYIIQQYGHKNAIPLKHILSFSDNDPKVMATGKAKDLESRNSQIHPQLRCAFF